MQQHPIQRRCWSDHSYWFSFGRNFHVSIHFSSMYHSKNLQDLNVNAPMLQLTFMYLPLCLYLVYHFRC